MTAPQYLHDDYLQHNLMLVRTGRKSRAPGIRRCPDCDEPFIDDHTGLPVLPTPTQPVRNGVHPMSDTQPETVEPLRFVLVCSECYEPAVLKPPREWTPAWGPAPPYSHWDGEPLCAVMTRDGYHSAQPKLVELQP